MSAYITLNTQFTDRECLVGALGSLNLDPAVHEQPVALRGWLKSDRKAEIVVPREKLKTHADIGFARNAQGSYDAIIDDLETDRLNMNGLKQAYAEKRARSLAAAHGMKLARKEQGENNVTRLVFQAAGR